MTRGGLPHSDIPGSKLVCSSPGLFAACHVLHRLLAPRHSPYTLSSLTIKLKTDAHQSFACQLVCDSFFRKHCVCLWSEKTTVCRIFSCQRSGLPDSAGNLVTSGTSRSAAHAALNDRCRRRCRRSRRPHHSTETFSKIMSAKLSGEYRSRTGDLLVANQALSQLS